MGGMIVSTRPVALDDVPAIGELLCANREFLLPFEPARPDDYFSPEGQEPVIRTALERYAAGITVPHVILVDGRIVGRINLNDIVRGPFLNAHLGYWVSQADNGRGVATAAVRHMTRVAFEEEGLHRIQSGTMLHNAASQKVLERNGFIRFGVAEKYLKIAGKWEDHVLFQLLADAEGQNAPQ
ncbi:GNAT family N-acetyltransferase [Streptomyces sp. NPDC002187]|uniref:GNAT family N-acetyltransferase n=1 Tax=Streptomyces sp. NPDC002187 TaxID=3364637 RepID=UPI0036C453E9